MVQLNPPLPMRIVGGIVEGQAWKGPLGNCMAVGWLKEHTDHHIVWICVMDATGQVWEVENPYIRARANLTWGRNDPDKDPLINHFIRDDNHSS